MPADRRSPSRSGDSRPKGDAGSKRSGAGRPTRSAEQRTDRGPRDPVIPDDADVADLDQQVLNELRTLPEGLAEMVARHLVAAQLALDVDDVDRAAAHVAAARRRASRVAAVREASGIVLYRAGEYAKALNELRTLRRMTGSDEFVPMMADCERGLGRPERALVLLREMDLKAADPPLRVEALLVTAGARADLGQLDAALVVLIVPELTELPEGSERARLQFGYADILERLGRLDEAREWFERAEISDISGVTDAAERAAGISRSDL